MKGSQDRRMPLGRQLHDAIMVPALMASFIILVQLLSASVTALDYREALEKSLLYFEAQRSGHLPYHQRVKWRGHSALTDGLEQGVDLVGGYYDAGDNIKFGLPMAFTVTMLSWGVVEYGDEIKAAGELEHALEAIKWGTDYFIKAHPHPHVLWAQVGDGGTDHSCWQRPEDMTTSRQAYRIDMEHPGSEVAGETAAAMAAASIAFKEANPDYSHLLLHHAQQLFEFGDKHRGKYDDSIPAVKDAYPSVSGYGDELLWAALWLHRATGREDYLDYALENAYALGGADWAVSEFSWDIKYAGLQVLASKILFEGRRDLDRRQTKILREYRSKAEHYLCSCMNKSNNDSNVRRTPAGLLYVRQWNNMQYVASGTFLLSVYSDYLAKSRRQQQLLHCPRGTASPQELHSMAKLQADYILGSNPSGLSYLVGYGVRYPTRVHHRAASSPSHKADGAFVGCLQGYEKSFIRQKENPNVLVGAVVGGPDNNDEFRDERGNYVQTEACTYNTAPLVGVFAKLNQLEGRRARKETRVPYSYINWGVSSRSRTRRKRKGHRRLFRSICV